MFDTGVRRVFYLHPLNFYHQTAGRKFPENYKQLQKSNQNKRQTHRSSNEKITPRKYFVKIAEISSKLGYVNNFQTSPSKLYDRKVPKNFIKMTYLAFTFKLP